MTNNEIMAGMAGTATMFLIIIAVSSIPAWIFLATYIGIGVLFGNLLQLDAYDEQYKREQLILDNIQLEERNLKAKEYNSRSEEYKALQQTGHWINPDYKEDKK
jgi:hypothetical protein